LEDSESAVSADSELAGDYKQDAMSNLNRQPNDPPPDAQEKKDSTIYGDITKGLYNYAQTYNMPSKIATEIGKSYENISVPIAKGFIEKLLYGIYKMASDPAQNEAFERLMHSIGVTIDANILTKNNEA
jgi:hypothetical protein